MELAPLIGKAIIALPPLLVAVILHEIAHGWTAEKLGDPTARKMGRITLNPLVHIDPFMTLFLPGLLIFLGSLIVFGGAKPVPINPLNFQNPRRAMVWVALAGPLTNFFLAGLGYLGFLVFKHTDTSQMIPPGIALLGFQWVLYSVLINLVLGAFNLLPIPPLDGGRIATGLLPLSLAKPLARLEPIGLFIVVLLLYLGVLDKFLDPIVKFAAYFLISS